MDEDPAAVMTWHARRGWSELRSITLAALVLCVFLAVVEDGYERWVALAAILPALGVLAWTEDRKSRPGKPYLTLTPEGVLIMSPGMPDVGIPWAEVRAVVTHDHVAKNRYSRFRQKVRFDGLTALVIDRRFYDAHIHVGSLFLRGPGWENTFIPRGEQVLVALHHELLDVDPQLLRDAVEARWRRHGIHLHQPLASETQQA